VSEGTTDEDSVEYKDDSDRDGFALEGDTEDGAELEDGKADEEAGFVDDDTGGLVDEGIDDDDDDEMNLEPQSP